MTVLSWQRTERRKGGWRCWTKSNRWKDADYFTSFAIFFLIFFLVQKVHLGRRFSFFFFLPFSGLVMNGKYRQANGTTAYWSHYNKRGEPERVILSDGRRLLNGKGEKFQFSRPTS